MAAAFRDGRIRIALTTSGCPGRQNASEPKAMSNEAICALTIAAMLFLALCRSILDANGKP